MRLGFEVGFYVFPWDWFSRFFMMHISSLKDKYNQWAGYPSHLELRLVKGFSDKERP